MVAAVHAAAAFLGVSGFGHIFHVFLVPEQNECFDSTYSLCYSPDNPAAFVFCGYHNSADFADVGLALLGFASGSMDALAFFNLGEVFPSMTGISKSSIICSKASLYAP